MARLKPLIRWTLAFVLSGTMPLATMVSAQAQGPGSSAPIRPFRLDEVRLGDGMFQAKRDNIKAFLKEYDERRFLILFNRQAGRPNPDLDVPGGWEDGGLLSGHWAGHYMTALAQGYADQGEDAELFKSKLDWMVNELAECQKAITDRMDTAKTKSRARTTSDFSPLDKRQATNATIGRVAGKFGNALQLNSKAGSNQQYITMPQETVNQLRDFTIATWVKLGAVQTYARIFDVGMDTTTYMYLVANYGGVPTFAITTSGSGGEQRVQGTEAIPTGQWVHIAISLASGTGTLYINGEMVGIKTGITLNPSSLNSPSNRWIGRSQYSDPYLNATLDEFHILDRALSGEEVKSLQTSADGSTGGGNIAWYRFDEEAGTEVEDSSPNGRDAGIVLGETGPAPDPSDWIPTHPGYLGALPEDTVIRLGPPRFAVYGSNPSTNTWAPWYTQHKIMRGLLDAYYHTDNQVARDVVVKMAEWGHLALTRGDINHPDYTGNLTRSDLNYMWDTYIAGETGGANEVFSEIYKLTGDARHLETARAFDNRESLFDAAVADEDILVVTPANRPGRRRPERLHVNMHVPHFVGLMRIFEHTGDPSYHAAAKNFFGWIVPHREFVSGGTGGNYPGSNNNQELFQNRDNIANAIASGGAETCSAYNTIKLARELFMHEHDAAYMDAYEWGLFNMIAGSRRDDAGAGNDEPQVTYFQPLTPGSRREYGNTGTCCGGTGLESHTKYQETVYLHTADDSSLLVNLYVPSTLTWTSTGYTIRQQTAFPRGDTANFTILAAGPEPLEIRLRVPAWARKGYHVAINGAPHEGPAAQPGSYLPLTPRTWKAGDVVSVHMPFTMRAERARDKPETQALLWGPTVLQIVGSPPGGAPRHFESSLAIFGHSKVRKLPI